MTAIYKVQGKHLNEHATLYGGQLLEWIDSYCFAKTEKYRNKMEEKFVTRATNCEFLAPILIGEIIQIKLTKEQVKNTSITFDYEVLSKEKMVAKGSSTFVKTLDNRPVSII